MLPSCQRVLDAHPHEYEPVLIRELIRFDRYFHLYCHYFDGLLRALRARGLAVTDAEWRLYFQSPQAGLPWLRMTPAVAEAFSADPFADGLWRALAEAQAARAAVFRQREIFHTLREAFIALRRPSDLAMAAWMGVPQPNRFRQHGPYCMAITMEFAVWREAGRQPQEILATLRTPPARARAQLLQHGYMGRLKFRHPIRLQLQLLRAACIGKLRDAQGPRARLPAAGPVPGMYLRPFFAQLELQTFLVLWEQNFPVHGAGALGPPAPQRPAAQGYIDDGLAGLTAVIWQSFVNGEIRHLDQRIGAGGVILVSLRLVVRIAHVVLLDLHAHPPGLFDPNLGYFPLGQDPYEGNYLAWLLGMLMMHYNVESLELWGLPPGEPSQLAPATPGMRRVKLRPMPAADAHAPARPD